MLGHQRLVAQQLTAQDFSTPREVVAWLGAVQAQDHAASKWAVGLRLRAGGAPAPRTGRGAGARRAGSSAAWTDEHIEQAIAAGELVRIHALRGTWQLLAPEDVHWMLAVCAARVIASSATRYRQLELDEPTLRRSRTVLERALRGGAALTREELVSALEGAGISTSGQRLAHLFLRAELDGLICGGPRKGKQFTYTLLERVAPTPAARPDRQRGIEELARRYFLSRGPATLDDFRWWSGLPASEARAGLEAVRPALASDEVGGRTYWSPARAGVKAGSRVAYLLPAFDEYLVAYQNRDAVLAPERAQHYNAGGGMLNPVVVFDGRVIGTWRRELSRDKVAIALAPFDGLTGRQREAVGAAAERYGRFLGLAPEVVGMG